MPKSGTIRTDLALEARQLWQERAGTETLSGVRAVDREREGFAVHVVEILDESGEAALGKPRGRYVTVELDGLLRRETDAFPRAASALAAELRELLALDADGSCLVAGLGNRDITPDAIGPDTVSHIIVTRHLKERLPEDFARLRPVSAICTGVLGTTGIESGELVRTVCASLCPDCVIAVDALASRSPDRLCRTVQLSDTGIVPGSGVGNARRALNRETLGVPVIAVGVPTVVDAATLTLDLAARGGVELSPAAFVELGSMIVTPRDVDKTVRDVGKLIGYAVNLALHEGMTVEEVDLLIS